MTMTRDSPHVYLRPLDEQDATDITRACAADPVIMRWVMRLPNVDSSAARRWISERIQQEQNSERITRIAVDESSDKFLGSVWIGRFDNEARRGELAYWTAPDVRNRGVGTAAVRLMTDYGFRDMDLIRIEILPAVKNLASQRVAENAGFTREGVLRSYRRIDGKHTDLIMYSLLESDWAERR